jgi:pentatricopeptide repeat protein
MHERNFVCCRSMVSGYTQLGKLRELIHLFSDMQITRMEAEDDTIPTVVFSYAQMGAFDLG